MLWWWFVIVIVIVIGQLKHNVVGNRKSYSITIYKVLAVPVTLAPIQGCFRSLKNLNVSQIVSVIEEVVVFVMITILGKPFN